MEQITVEQKLSREEVAKVFAIYLGRELEWYGYVGKPQREVLAGINIMFGRHYALFAPNTNDGMPAENCKLLLTPLSSLIDEHAIEVARMGSFKANLLEYGHEVIKGFTGLKDYAGICAIEAIGIYQYFIQQGYAVPLFFGVNHACNGKTAIELNLAIDRTTL